MRRLHMFYRMELIFDTPVREHYFSLRCIPCSDAVQQVEHIRREVFGAESLHQVTDGFGNQKLTGCIRAPHDRFGYEVEGDVRVDRFHPQEERLSEIYRYPSKLTGYGAAAEDFLETLPPLSGTDFSRAQQLMHRLYAYMRYTPGVTGFSTTAEEALSAGMGVCQDYAHILTVLCRQVGIPARYVTGLMIGEGFSHAWVEIFDAGRWFGLDPTNDLLADDFYIKLAHGRDAADCAVDRGVFRGNARQTQKVCVKVEERKDD